MIRRRGSVAVAAEGFNYSGESRGKKGKLRFSIIQEKRVIPLFLLFYSCKALFFFVSCIVSRWETKIVVEGCRGEKEVDG